MLIPVEMTAGPSSWRVRCALLPGCEVEAGDLGVALARLRLALEAEIATRLGRGEALPAFDAEGPGDYQVHINLRHLQALAEHQQGRWD